jgi:trigger factor
MKYRVIADSSLEKQIEFPISKEELSQKLKTVLLEKGKGKTLTGFRPGKAPLPLLFREFAEEAFKKTILSFVKEASLAVKDQEWSASSTVSLVNTLEVPSSLENIEDINLQLRFFIPLQFPKIDFKSVSIEDITVTPSEKEVQEELARRASEARDLRPLASPRPAEKGDALVYKMEYLDANGKKSSSEGVFILGSGQFPKEFEEGLIGISEGHVIDEKVKVPKNFPMKQLAGKKLSMHLLFSEIKEAVPFNVDDHFAKEMGAKSLKEYTETVRKELSDYLTNLFAPSHKVNKVLSFLKETLSFDIYKEEWEEKTEEMLKEIQKELEKATEEEKKKILQGYSLSGDVTPEVLKKELYKEVGQRLRVHYFLEHILEKEKITLTASELERIVDMISKNSKETPKDVLIYIRNNPVFFEKIKNDFLQQKVLSWISNQCTLVPVSKSSQELTKLEEKIP